MRELKESETLLSVVNSCRRVWRAIIKTFFPIQQTTYRIGSRVCMLLGMVEARSVKMTNTQDTHTRYVVGDIFQAILLDYEAVGYIARRV